MENRLPWQQRGISISQLLKGIEGPDLAIDLKHDFCCHCHVELVAMATK